MKTIISTLFVAGLLLIANPASASHEGYVVCEDSGSAIGDDCFDNWDVPVNGDPARQVVARKLGNRYGTGCIPHRFWPEWAPLGCKIDLNDTFDVCKTATGPCYRFRWSFLSVLEVVSGPNPSPGGDLIEAKHWIPYSNPGQANLTDEKIYCTGSIPVFSVSAGPSNSVPAFFKIEKLVSGSWVDAFSGYANCILNQGSGYQFRAKALNPDGETGWVNVTTSGTCGGGQQY